MIVVRIELHSAITGKITEIARAIIYNDERKNPTHNPLRGNYVAFTAPGVTKEHMIPPAIYRRRKHEVFVLNYARKSKHVWHLVARALNTMGFK